MNVKQLYLGAACVAMCMPSLARAQTTPTASENYLLFRKARVAVTSQQAFDLLSSSTEVAETVQYFDGLGRSTQTIEVAGSPSEADVVSFQVYDDLGRRPVEYMPFTSAHNGGGFRSNPIAEQAFFYGNSNFPDIPQNDLLTPFSESIFETSPLNRIIEQGAPGEDWQVLKINGQSTGLGNTVKTTTRANTAADMVLRWRPHASGVWYATAVFENLTQLEIYSAGELLVTETGDQNGHITQVFTDKLGRVLLKRTLIGDPSSQNPHDAFANTYYLFDDQGNLRFVLQPEGCTSLSLVAHKYVLTQELAEQFAFQYRYDTRQRVIEKRIPGADWIYNVYDPLDRLVATQDGILRQTGNWLFTKYDVLGRPIITGVFDNPSNYGREDVQNQLNLSWNNGFFDLFETKSAINFSSQFGYTDQAFPALSHIVETHSVTYYDDYDFDRDGQADVSYIPVPAFPNAASDQVVGMVTGVKIRVLDAAPDMPDWLMTVTFYDEYGREVQTMADNHLSDGAGGFNQDLSTHAYNFVGDVIKTQISHNVNLPMGPQVTFLKTFAYDHRSRLEEVRYKLNGMPEVILSAQEYNELGQVIEKNLHSQNGGANFLQSLDYAYNIQGWLTAINDVDAPMLLASCNSGGGRGSGSGIILDKIGVQIRSKSSPGGDILQTKVFVNEEVEMSENNGQVTVNLVNAGTALEQNVPLTTSLNAVFVDTVLIDFPNVPIDSVSMYSIGQTIKSEIANKMCLLGFNQTDQEAVGQASTGLLHGEWGSILDHDDNRDLFAERISYNEDDGNMHADAAAQYNGNIRSMQIRTAGSCAVRRWDYSYDKLNRLTNAHYKARDGQSFTNPWTLETGRYSTTDFTYDFNGNLKSLTRFGKVGVVSGLPTYGKIDELTYEYLGNRLIEVSDAITANIPAEIQHFVDGSTTPVTKTIESSHEYRYDAAGNMTEDKNKGITSITYNHLKKPTEVVVSPTKKITYIYSADGTKLRQTVIDGSAVTSFDYSNGFHYKTDPTGQNLEFFATEEGRVVVGSTMHFEYTLKDHLGNSRVSLREDPMAVGQPMVIQENHYYAFGMEISDLGTVTGLPNDYLYNGKERQDELGLNWYDYGARMYDPSIGRWNGVDALAEKYRSNSPYTYTLNNPILYVDPDGRYTSTFDRRRGGRASTQEQREAWQAEVSGTWDHLESMAPGAKHVSSQSPNDSDTDPPNSNNQNQQTGEENTDNNQQPGIQIILQRTIETNQSTIGEFVATGSNGETVTGVMLEPEEGTPEEAVTENSGKRIQAGTYNLIKYNAPQNGFVFLIVDVPGRTYVLIHVGNFSYETTACCLPGSPSQAANTVESSTAKLNELKNLTADSLGVENFGSIPEEQVVGTITIIDPSDD